MSNRLEQFREYFEKHSERFVDTLKRVVEMETPSADRERIDQLADFVSDFLRRYCDRVSVVAGELGARVRAEKGGGDKTVLILCHMDTVWPVDAENKPVLRFDGDKLHGPGIFDMKAGLCMTLFAFEAYSELDIEPDRRLVLLCTPDEELGSPSSREPIEREAADVAATVVLEPPLDDGRLKMRRKGGGTAELEVFGREAHAGINPQDGVNAIHELAMQIVKLAELNDYDRGLTINADIVEGGTRDNVVPGYAKAIIDFRAMTTSDAEEVERTLQGLEPILEGARLSVKGGFQRPPMEETPESRKLAALAQDIAGKLGMELEKGLSGGASDGSFTAALGIPTIDGLGLDGAGAHSSHEHVVVSRIPQRCALLAELLLSI